MIIFFLLLHAIGGCTQNDSRIQLRVLDSFILEEDSTAKISFKLECKNLTDSTYLLYGVDGPLGNFPKKAEDIHNYLSKMSAACNLYIYDKEMQEVKMNTLPFVQEFHKKYREMPKVKADSIVAASNAEYLKHTKVIMKDAWIYLQKEVDLKPYELTRGTYYLQVVYCSGDKISVRIPPVQIDLDKKTHSATVYRGCAISNIVKFEIE